MVIDLKTLVQMAMDIGACAAHHFTSPHLCSALLLSFHVLFCGDVCAAAGVLHLHLEGVIHRYSCAYALTAHTFLQKSSNLMM